MRNGLRFMGLAAVAALSLTALAAQGGVIIKRTPKVGDVVKLRMKGTMESQAGGQSFELNGVLVEKVTDVKDDQYTTVSETPELKVSFNGTELDVAGQQPPVTTVTKSTGEIVSLKSDNMNEDSYRMANLQSIQFPTTPLKVGDTWQYEIKKDDKGSAPAKASFKVEAQEKIDGVDTYKITGSLKETGGSSPASAEGTYWVSISDGIIVKATVTTKNAPMGELGLIDSTMTLTRIK